MKSSVLIINIFLINSFCFSQTQVGEDLKGEFVKDQFGTAISLSDDGSIVAVAAKENDEIASNSGHVRIFEWNNETWTQLGSDINGFASSDRLGTSISLSADGRIIACGAPDNGAPKGYAIIKEWNGNAWISKGDMIEGVGVSDRFGTSISISSDGNRVAVGAVGNDDIASNAGQVKIYEWDESNWVQMGMEINGQSVGDNAGSDISLSADGNRIAIGASENSESNEKVGKVRVFEWDESSTWTQMGMDIAGEDTRDESGSQVVLSQDGNRLAISAPFNDGNGTWSGHVRVYKWEENIWKQLGKDIDGEGDFDRSGWSLDMGDNGNLLIIGALNNGDNGAQAGHARIFEWKENEWVQKGVDIDGDMAQDLLGYSVAFSENGLNVAVGAPINGNAFDNNAGYARVYSIEGDLSTSIAIDEMLKRINIYPNPVDNVLSIDMNLPNEQIVLVEIQDLSGQQISRREVSTRNIIQLNISDLPEGLYVVRIEGQYLNRIMKFVKI